VLAAVMEHMAALAERLEIARPVVGGVVIEMGGGQRHLCCGEGPVLDRRRSARNPGKRPALPVAPGCAFLIPPAAIAEVKDHAAVGSPASFATSLGPSEPDEGRELRPVNWIEPPVLRANRHRRYFLDARPQCKFEQREESTLPRAVRGHFSPRSAISTPRVERHQQSTALTAVNGVNISFTH
jgi:hypothetical protein